MGYVKNRKKYMLKGMQKKRINRHSPSLKKLQKKRGEKIMQKRIMFSIHHTHTHAHLDQIV
jgi:hypothetical protein